MVHLNLSPCGWGERELGDVGLVDGGEGAGKVVCPEHQTGYRTTPVVVTLFLL